MINVPVNENIDSYKNTVIMGLTLMQTVSLMIAVLVGSIEFLFIHFFIHLDLMLCSLVIIPTVGVIVMGMNYEKDGLNLIEIISTGRYKKRIDVLYYQSTETVMTYGDVSVEEVLSFEEQEAKKEEDFEKTTKLLILAMIVGVLIILGVAIGFVMYMS